MPDLIGVKFKKTGKFLFFKENGVKVKCGDQCVVETDHGTELGIVIIPAHTVGEKAVNNRTRRILRIATEEDVRISDELSAREREAMSYCRSKIEERNLEMKLVAVDFTLDCSKAIFYFTADGRIDFRDLVKDLAHEFHLRIEMRQIGVRDEAKMLGGIGVCGRPLCCSQFLNRFEPVSIKMAKAQNLILNPSKISGICGRLMCCINFEIDRDCGFCGKKGKKETPPSE
ncbi:MAG: stage 0 sporulation family protein [Acidobacteria bacterium]|nr:stage 0 sporulation family protein [Acidobacteriota bacterium]